MTDTCFGVHADMPFGKDSSTKAGKPKFDYAIWDNAITMVCLNDFYTFNDGKVDGKKYLTFANECSVPAEHEGFEGSPIQDYLKSLDELQQLKKNHFHKKLLVSYYNPNYKEKQEQIHFHIHFLLFDNWTLCSVPGASTIVETLNNIPISVNYLKQWMDQGVYPHIKAYHESFVQYKNHQAIQDKLQNVHHLTQCLQSEQNTQYTKIEEQISDITKTVNEWMDECDTRFTTLFGISETLQKDQEEWFVIKQELNELSHLKNKVAEYSSKQDELHNWMQQQNHINNHLSEQISKSNQELKHIKKDVQNEKWILFYFMVISLMLYVINI